jgi:hypothetical protein
MERAPLMICLTSTVPYLAMGCLEASPIASSRLAFDGDLVVSESNGNRRQAWRH